MEASELLPFEVVAVPFPFTDKHRTKKRPAVILSYEGFNWQAGHAVLAMITSAKNSEWPLDVIISDLKSAGLPAPSVVRMKLFTLDQRLIIQKLGRLDDEDVKQLQAVLKRLLPVLHTAPSR